MKKPIKTPERKMGLSFLEILLNSSLTIKSTGKYFLMSNQFFENMRKEIFPNKNTGFAKSPIFINFNFRKKRGNGQLSI